MEKGLEYIEQVKKAKTGKDVREPIADMMELVYPVLTTPNQNADVTSARGDYDTLADRLDANTSKIQAIIQAGQLIKSIFKKEAET